VLSAERPLTAFEILDALRPKDPSATPAGVHRSPDFLTELGLVHRIESAKSFIAALCRITRTPAKCWSVGAAER
jgi:Fur family transcriptional regulator, zinc uptake regulator